MQETIFILSFGILTSVVVGCAGDGASAEEDLHEENFFQAESEGFGHVWRHYSELESQISVWR